MSSAVSYLCDLCHLKIISLNFVGLHLKSVEFAMMLPGIKMRMKLYTIKFQRSSVHTIYTFSNVRYDGHMSYVHNLHLCT